ncbi:MAG TPA: GFA family protein [Solirubrobacteraceae bacterium]|nr:GFA family protein [Solirubrobacteraceae bacterium]
MANVPQPLTGRCLCGAVTYSVNAAPIAQAVCHCTECQRQTSSPFSVVVGVPKDDFTVSGDTLTSFETTAEDHGGKTERNFCSACGSPLFSLSPAAPDFVFIKAGSLDDSSWLEPRLEVWTRSAQPWSPRLAGAVQMERGPQ